MTSETSKGWNGRSYYLDKLWGRIQTLYVCSILEQEKRPWRYIFQSVAFICIITEIIDTLSASANTNSSFFSVLKTGHQTVHDENLHWNLCIHSVWMTLDCWRPWQTLAENESEVLESVIFFIWTGSVDCLLHLKKKRRNKEKDKCGLKGFKRIQKSFGCWWTIFKMVDGIWWIRIKLV